MGGTEAAERRFRSVLGHFATGVTVVTAIRRGVPMGMTVQSFSSLSLRPPLVLFCPGLVSTTWPAIEPVGRLCVNLLAEDQEGLALQFSRTGADKFRGVAWSASRTTGSPVLEGALGWVDCGIERVHRGGDHLIVVSRVLDLEARRGARPLLFFRGGFQRMGQEEMAG
jgi:3-hydroxy-9,10-secoandrosta-1,3,5(10)-triene-9,17-dione monooxygenase reductase component